MIWKKTKTPAACILLFFFTTASLALAQSATAEEHVPGRLLAKRVDSASETTVTHILAAAGAKVHHKIDGTGVLVLDVPDRALDAMAGVLSSTGLFPSWSAISSRTQPRLERS